MRRMKMRNMKIGISRLTERAWCLNLMETKMMMKMNIEYEVGNIQTDRQNELAKEASCSCHCPEFQSSSIHLNSKRAPQCTSWTYKAYCIFYRPTRQSTTNNAKANEPLKLNCYPSMQWKQQRMEIKLWTHLSKVDSELDRADGRRRVYLPNLKTHFWTTNHFAKKEFGCVSEIKSLCQTSGLLAKISNAFFFCQLQFFVTILLQHYITLHHYFTLQIEQCCYIVTL